MATHSSVLAWRIPGMGEPSGLPSMGSHRVGHNWSNLAAAAISFGVNAKILMISYKTTLSGSAPNSPSPFPFNLQLHFSLPIIYTSLRGTCLTWNLATHMFYSVMDTSLNICLVHSLPLGLCSFIVTSEASLTTQYKNRITPFSNSNRITRFAVETGDGWHSAIFESQMNSK